MPPTYPRYEIETTDSDEKSRSFRAMLLAFLSWESFRIGKSRTATPLFAAFAATDGELRPFLANLQCGAAARLDGAASHSAPAPYFFSLGDRPVHRRFVQRIGSDLVATHFVPNLFSLDPPPGTPCQFVLCPPRAWLEKESARLAEMGVERPDELALARYFVAFVDRRTAFPIPPTPEIHRALYRTFREQELASGSEENSSITAFGFRELGYAEPQVVNADNETLETLLRDLISTHLPKDTYDGATRLSTGGWLLPDPSHALAGAGLRF